jgi:hypothetical protein
MQIDWIEGFDLYVIIYAYTVIATDNAMLERINIL